MNMVKLQPFDTARHLDNPEVIHWYLAEALQTGDVRLFLRAVQNVARANNMSKIARETAMSRTSLYWGENTSPEFTTVMKVLERLGVRLRVEPIAKATPRKLGKRLFQATREAAAFAHRDDPKTYRVHTHDDDAAVRVPAGVFLRRDVMPLRAGKKTMHRSHSSAKKATVHRSAKAVARKKKKHPVARKRK
jgi:probable addiction module antidote protein